MVRRVVFGTWFVIISVKMSGRPFRPGLLQNETFTETHDLIKRRYRSWPTYTGSTSRGNIDRKLGVVAVEIAGG